VIQYAVIFGGFALALAALGMDLTKLTILASAFGVGAGLGLQTVVNNFASGLILLFERPIHLGDVVQVAGIAGEVRHIGVRATLVRTADGAEVFVPNSLLIAQSVTNWTYSDLRRRIVLPVRVAYGAAPQRVTELLTAIGARHPQVSGDPAAAAVFMGFGENSLDFELRAWTDRFGDSETIQSQLADSVYAALNEARIDLPVPGATCGCGRLRPSPERTEGPGRLPSSRPARARVHAGGPGPARAPVLRAPGRRARPDPSSSPSAPAAIAARPCAARSRKATSLPSPQAICDYRRGQGIDGPLYMGKDTHAVSGPAERTALEVLAANGVEVIIQRDDGVTPTPVVSHAILVYNHGRTAHVADGISGHAVPTTRPRTAASSTTPQRRTGRQPT